MAGRRGAADAPERSAAERPDSHLLGRVYVPDGRDWRLERLMTLVEPADNLLQMTLQELIDGTTYFSKWSDFLALWRWVKQRRHPADSTPVWEDLIQLDQGQTGHCVGFGWSGWGNSAPIEDRYQNSDAHALYYQCKVIDGEPGKENGSTVRSGALAMRARGQLAAFAFATTLGEIDHWIDAQGPVVVGTDWTNDMFNPDANGFVRPTGSLAGGHCYLILDKVDQEDAYLFENSWGLSWGQQGRFKMKRADFDSLLGNNGEACCGLEIRP